MWESTKSVTTCTFECESATIKITALLWSLIQWLQNSTHMCFRLTNDNKNLSKMPWEESLLAYTSNTLDLFVYIYLLYTLSNKKALLKITLVYESAEVRRNPATAARERKRWKMDPKSSSLSEATDCHYWSHGGLGVYIYQNILTDKSKTVVSRIRVHTNFGNIPDVSQTFPNQICFKMPVPKLKPSFIPLNHLHKSWKRRLLTSDQDMEVYLYDLFPTSTLDFFFPSKNNKNVKKERICWPFRSGKIATFCESLHFLHTQTGFARFPYFGQTMPFKIPKLFSDFQNRWILRSGLLSPTAISQTWQTWNTESKTHQNQRVAVKIPGKHCTCTHTDASKWFHAPLFLANTEWPSGFVSWGM